MEADLKGLDKQFWNKHYLQQTTGWDMGVVSPPIKKYIDSYNNKDARILIPGAGNAYEAVYLIENGFANVTVIDISPHPIQELRKKYGEHPNFHSIEGDFFQHEGTYDLIIEQTFFCAIAPSLRESYVSKINDLLSENGKLVGVMFNRNFEGGPPFGGSVEEYKLLFEPIFKIKTMEKCEFSHPARKDAELWVEIEQK